MSQILKEQTIHLDMLRQFSGAIRGIVAGDTGNRLHILIEEDGTAVNLAAGHRVVLVVYSGRGVVTQDSGVAGNGVTFTTGTNQVDIELFASTFAAGSNFCVLQLYSTGSSTHDTLVSAMPFNFEAARVSSLEDAIEGSPEFPALVATTARCTHWFAGTAITGTGSGIVADVPGAVTGDFYFSSAARNVYTFNGTTWDFVSELKGDKGEKGDEGEIPASVQQLITAFDALGLSIVDGHVCQTYDD